MFTQWHLDRDWLRTLAEQTLRRDKSERGAFLADRCRDPRLRETLTEIFEQYPEAALESGGALRGALFEDLLAALGEDSVPSPGSEDLAAEGLGRDKVGRLRIERLLQAGGMGAVYEAFDELLERPVALKVLHAKSRLSPAARARFLREARLLSQLDHPHICKLFDWVEFGGQEALVLELVVGESLDRKMAGGGLLEAEKLRIAAQIAQGLRAAHATGVIHRDLKPANVMLNAQGEVKIVDFGIARRQDGAALGEKAPAEKAALETDSEGLYRTSQGTTLGTIAYMSPEQMRGEEVGPASDIYSLAVLLLELLKGSPAYSYAHPAELLGKVSRGEVAGLDALAPAWRVLLAKMLALDPAARPSAEEVLAEIESLRSAPARRRRVRQAAALVFALVGILALLWLRGRQAQQPFFQPGEKPRLVVLPFANGSADPGLSWVEMGLAEMVGKSLASLPSLEVVPFDQVTDLLRQRPAAPVSTASASLDALEIPGLARALGANLLLSARVEKDGDAFRIVYKTERPGFLARTRAVEAADPFAAAAELAASLAQSLTPQAPLPDLRDHFSADPFVSQLYAMGLERLRGERGQAAEPFFRATLEMEPTLIDASQRLAEALGFAARWQDSTLLAEEVVQKSGKLARPDLLTEAYISLAGAAHGRGDRPAAVVWGEKAVAAARASGARDLEAKALFALGRPLRFLDPEKAREAWEQALAMHRATGNRLGEAKAIHGLGVLAYEAGEGEKASEIFAQALALAEELQAPRLEAICLNSLAIRANDLRHFDEGVALLERAMAAHRKVVDKASMIFTLNTLGDIFQEIGQTEKAEETLAEGEGYCSEIKAPNACALLGFNYGELLLLTGRAEAARPLVERAEAYYGNEDSDILYLRAMQAAHGKNRPLAMQLLEKAAKSASAAQAKDYRAGVEQIFAEQRQAAN